MMHKEQPAAPLFPDNRRESLFQLDLRAGFFELFLQFFRVVL